MTPITEDINMNIEERIMNALSEEFRSKSPDYKLTEDFKEFLRGYIHLSFGIAQSNMVDQILEFIKTARLCDPNVSITLIETYLKTTEFKYKPIKQRSYVKKGTEISE
jgi:hypothetical protein